MRGMKTEAKSQAKTIRLSTGTLAFAVSRTSMFVANVKVIALSGCALARRCLRSSCVRNDRSHWYDGRCQ